MTLWLLCNNLARQHLDDRESGPPRTLIAYHRDCHRAGARHAFAGRQVSAERCSGTVLDRAQAPVLLALSTQLRRGAAPEARAMPPTCTRGTPAGARRLHAAGREFVDWSEDC